MAELERIVNPEAIVILPKGITDRSRAILPTRTTDIPATFQNSFGAKWNGKGIMAVFPLSVLGDENELHVVFDHYRNGGIGTACDDCAVPFKLKGIR